MWLKRMLLTGVLAIGVGGVSLGAEAVAADRHESPWERVVDPHGPIEAVASSEVRRVHSLTVKSQTIEWKVDVQIRGEKGRACVVEVEFCNAAGNPYIGRDGKPVRFQETVTPDSDDYKATGVTFQLWAQMYRFYYGRQAGELTFRVVVRDRKSDQVINQPAVTTLKGLAALLPPSTPERTDNPNPSRPGSAWMRLIFG